MKRFSYRDRDYSFGQAMLTLRSAIGMTQSDMADILGVSRRAVGAWEAGSKYPKAVHLKKFIALAIQHNAFPTGTEAEEIRALWGAARQKVLLNEAWLASLLASQSSGAPAPAQRSAPQSVRTEGRPPVLNLPFQPTPFIGREAELAEIGRLLADPACRLLTLLGPGGIGKTRLGIESARGQTHVFRDSVAFVALASIGTPSQIAPAIGDALNLSFSGQADSLTTLLDDLRERHMLLVLDNFEHVLDGADLVYDILQHAPNVTILVTSRVRLNLQAEWLFDVDGLSYPSVGAPDATDITHYSAVELFMQRATQVHLAFQASTSSLATISRICQQVAGMPLAIELAAAGVRTLSVAEIEGQIGANLDALSTSLRDVQPRHRSMRAVFDHSWNLLTEPERVLFIRLSVFRGGCSIDAAQQVTGAALPALMSLVNKSLLRQDTTPSTDRSNTLRVMSDLRFSILEPIREYALEKLNARGEMQAVQQTHATYYLEFAEAVMASWNKPALDPASEQINRDLNNIRAALRWACDGGHATIGLQLAGVLWRFWRSGGYSSEGRGWLDELLALDESDDDTAALSARLLGMHAAAWLASDQHDYKHATQLFEQTVSLRRTLGGTEADTHLLHNAALQARAVGDYQQATTLLEEALARNRALSTGGLGQSLYEMGFSLYGLALMLREQGDYAPAIALYEESLQFHQEIGDRESMAQALLGLGDVARDQGDTDRARGYTEQSLAIYREFGTQWAIGFALNNLAQAAYLDGEIAQAYAFATESISIFRATQNEGGLAEALVTLGHILPAQEDMAGAQDALTEALRLAWVIGPRLLVVAALEALAVLMSQTGQTVLAAQFLGATSTLRTQMGTPMRPADQRALTRAISISHTELGEEDFKALWSEAGDEPLENLLSMLPGVIADRESPSPEGQIQPVEQSIVEAAHVTPSLTPSEAHRRVDWDDAVTVPVFYGRDWEMNLLSEWIIEERCRVVSVLGMGGIGKSSLAVRVMHRLAENFDVVIWRSLRDIPTCDVLSIDLVQTLALHTNSGEYATFEQRIKVILEHMRSTRILLVLDNLESVLEEGERGGQLLPGFEGFGQFLRKSAETEHQSCVLLTSREKPSELVPFEGSRAPVRALRLARLDDDSSEKLLAERGVSGALTDQIRLVEAYAGNPLALKIVAQTIVDLFDGEVTPFLEQGEVIFGGIRELLNQQFTRLSALEQAVLLWLTILREPATLDRLLPLLAVPVPRARLLETVEALRRRSLIERGPQRGSVTLQSVVLEYMTARIITEASDEIQSGNLGRIMLEHQFELAQAEVYVREIQQRLIVTPILERLRSSYSQQDSVESQVLALLSQLKLQPHSSQKYAPANLVTLLRSMRGNLRGLDLAGLALRGMYLQGVEMQDTNLTDALVRGTVFTETFDAVTAVATSRAGDYWATGTRRGEVQLWKAGELILHRAWRAHTDIICAVAFAPDGSTLATTGSWDGTVKLWDVASGALLWTGKHPSQAYTVVFSPDGRMLASTGYDAVVRLWDQKTGLQLHELLHPDPVCGVSWSSDERLLATGDLTGHIRLWEVGRTEAPVHLQTLDAHTNCVEGLAFSPDGHTLASGSWDGTAKLWDVASGSLLRTFSDYSDRVICVAWSSDGRIVASAGRDRTIWLWDAEQSSYHATMRGHTGGVYGIAFTPDTLKLLSGSEDSTLRVWEIGSARCTHFLQGYATSLYDVDWSPDGSQLVSGGSDALVTIYPGDRDNPPRLLAGHLGFVIGVGWSSNGRWLASSEWNNVVRLWDAGSGKCFQILHYPGEGGDYFDRLAWSPDGQHLAVGTYTHGLQLFQPTAQGQQWTGRYFPAPTWIRHVNWRSDGALVAGGGADGSIYIWDAADGTRVRRLEQHHSTVTDIAWSPDGRRLASTSRGKNGGELFVWDVQNTERILAVLTHPGMVYAVVWGINESLLISAGSDGLLRWWDVRTGQQVLECSGHQGTIHTLKRNPEGTKLASCGSDGAIMVWDLRSGEHLETIRRDRPYERLNITGITGLTEAQKAVLRTLGAVDHDIPQRIS